MDDKLIKARLVISAPHNDNGIIETIAAISIPAS